MRTIHSLALRASTLVFVVLLIASGVCVGEDLTLENVTAPAGNSAKEPMAKEFSLKLATRFLDQASLNWTKSSKCFTCHTNFIYVAARPSIAEDSISHRQVRVALEEMVEKRWESSGPRWDAEVVMSAATLALNDRATTGKLHKSTREALQRMWTVQKADGGVDWLKCGWPPMESDDHFGVTMMAIAAGAAPEAYRETETAKTGLDKIRGYFKANAPPTMHHRAMLLWADSYLRDIQSEEERKATIQDLLDLQKDDGGWALATLGDWKRSDGTEQDRTNSDGYGTGFVIYVLRRAGVNAKHPQLQKGVAWLKANQRASGRWYTRSLTSNGSHYISHAGTAFAAMAIAECESAE